MSNEKEFNEIYNYLVDYANKNNFTLNPDWEAVKRVIHGLIKRKEKSGELFCPCRPGTLPYFICPCIFHKNEIEKNGHCHCRLLFKK
ncbi:MAG: ferredoxin-thioredoxin reductase catalytic domain-containing protein [Nanoarchaeota archaeon]